MEEMLYKFINKGKREHEEMRTFICEFRTTNKILFKERNNSLSELRFEVQELLKVINNASVTNCEIKGVTTRCGKTMTQDVQNNNINLHSEEPLPSIEKQTSPVPFPRRLRKEKEEAQQKFVLENLKQLHINFPFIEALAQMPKSTKFLKGLLPNKARLKEAYMITMNERFSTVLLNKLPSKEKDPRSFTIPYDIGQLHINNALADLGASISLMPYTMYEKLGLGEPKATRMSLELADRPPAKDDECYGVDDLVGTINAEAQELLENDKSDTFLLMGLDKSIDHLDIESYESFEWEPIRRINSVNTPYPEAQEATKPNKVESEHLYLASANEIDVKKPELKNLPHHLEYVYLHGDKSFPIVILSELSEKEKMLLLQVLEKRKGAFAWKMSNIKGISPSYCTYKILMVDDYKSVIQPQRRLNPKVQDVLKNEIIKLLDSELIYPISDSSWVSPIHVVPKKGGMSVVLNDNNELIPSRTVVGWRVCIDYRKLNDATRKYLDLKWWCGRDTKKSIKFRSSSR
ncbi:DNA-directed DNA polymerase [Tanacetum coccineum]